MGLFSRLFIALVGSLFLVEPVKDYLRTSGALNSYKMSDNLIYGLCVVAIFLVLKVFARKRYVDSPAVEVIKSSAIPSQMFLTPADAEKIKKSFTNGNMIETIKMIRSMGNFGLKEAKDLAEQLKSSGFANVVVKSSGVTIDSKGSVIGSYDSSTEERLTQLNDLKEKNLISQSEYEEKRKEILGKL